MFRIRIPHAGILDPDPYCEENLDSVLHPDPHQLTLINMAMELYDTHSFKLPCLLKFLRTICIPSPKYCLYMHTFINL